MKEIELSKYGKNRGKYIALVDDEDYEYLSQFNWQYRMNRNRIGYATRIVHVNGKVCVIWMHRELMDPDNNKEVDHIDRNGLNNQKYNLRICSHRENGRNRKSWGRSCYLGVGYSGKQIQCHIKINDKNVYVGTFKTEKEAAIAYDKAAIVYHGEFANLNFK